jgi:alpha-mannosidase
VVRESTLAASDVIPYLARRMHARELYGYLVNGCRLGDRQPDGTRHLVIDVDRTPDPDDLDVDEVLDALAAETALTPADRWHISIVARPRLRLLAMPTVPALGWTTLRPIPDDDAVPAPAVAHPVVATDGGLSNVLMSVRVALDGTLEIDTPDVSLRGVGRIVDGGDGGDSYNYAPPPTDDLAEAPAVVEVSAGRAGPLMGDLTVRRTYRWPAGLLPDLSARTAGTVETGVDVTVEMYADEPWVRVTVELDNRSVDHRVRFHVPLPAPVDGSLAEGQFAIAERGLRMEGGHGEHPLPTFPAHGFVAAGNVALLLDHVTEYELLSEGEGAPATELALTLVRATGLISRDNNSYRDEPAGPVVEARTGQAQGIRRVTFALFPSANGPRDPAILAAAERFRTSFALGTGSGSGDLMPTSSDGLSLGGEAIVLSSLRDRATDDGLVRELRILREAPGAGRADVSGPFDAVRAVDLLGSPVEAWQPVDGHVELELGGWEIRTLQLRRNGEPAAAITE